MTDKQFEPLSSDELIEILGITIKKDKENKLITFLCELSAYTEDSQLNISFNAPSSTGKSYIPTEIARLFPEEDVREIGYCSPTAFFHDIGELDKEKKGVITVNLERKILIFLDQPHTQLLERLRPLLSHDKKEISIKITDKNQKQGLRTKNVVLRGFPSVIFCTAGLRTDEQEATRFILLSPQTDREKIREAIYEKIRKESNKELYRFELGKDPKRNLLKDRILAIREKYITDIVIDSPELIEEAFFSKNKALKPRHQRDIGRILSLVKVFALLNLWFRERRGTTIIANKDDIKEAFKVWDAISESQELSLPPYIHQIYREIIIPLWDASSKDGLTRPNIIRKHFEVHGRPLADWLLRQQIIPMLENSGLITQEADPNDKRKKLIYPTGQLTIAESQNNSESSSGVNQTN